jgi:hypothetical protein
MLTRLLSLLLLFATTVLTFAIECQAAKVSSFSVAGSLHPLAAVLESAADLAPPAALPANDSPRDTETQYHNCLPQVELFGSVSEKFDSLFGESLVLYLVAQPSGKWLDDEFVEKIPHTTSLVQMRVLLQV